MPLPTRNIAWPPPAEAEAAKHYTRFQAWYSGDPQALTDAYADIPGVGGADSEVPRGQITAPRFLGGLARGLQRKFWGTPPSPGQIRGHKLHIPLGGDIATTSADLVFGEPPKITIGGASRKNPTQARLDKILTEANAQAVFLEAAEVAAAYGGAYIRIRWDTLIADTPLLDVVPPDAAVPEWRGDRLVAVTFWRNLERLDSRFWRHLERHEPGRISHGLYVSGDNDKLGRPMALTEHPETAMFAMAVGPDDGQSMETGAKGLTAEYLPNIRPNRVMRGSPLGRSDYSGIEPVMDALDESWTSWMRDLRLGKGRLVVPRAYMQGQGRGHGASFDAEKEIFELVDSISSPDAGMQITIVQFAIRVTEHQQTCAELTTQALRGAGYSAQTFGEQGDMAQTATEVTARESASYRTRAKKILYARGPVTRILRTLLEVDKKLFGSDAVPDTPTLAWPDGVAIDPQQTATTVQLLFAAEAASIQRRVEMVNPDWESDEVDAEVKRIKDDAQAALPPAMAPPGSTAPAGPFGKPPGNPPPGTPGAKPPGNPPPAATPAAKSPAP